ncbi:hypothetical protein [Croceimicrobium hydrocarbonivorans]|uniref:Uncharacterized protein n=1 Tax=Croceimicrobium hydrocarbonivorans TaxID=2761580 RepID=A0A7H0VAM6_9FLAO|nr:hypothetical protein [Croceimicrobium hydrocarbonivorans]QNR22774.1 hypothetical protein H4K34_10315 [Croceimicrobium hydrocarbonivorans]
MITVKNKKSTSNRVRPAGYEDWLDLWKQKSGNTNANISCRVPGCIWPAEAGGHVFNVNSTSKEFITPLCREHNHSSFSDTFLVSEKDLVDPN